jgi:hypothetical protein
MQRTTHESESALELLLIEPENKIMGEKDENFPKVSITSEDIARIAIAVKDILKLDIEATVELMTKRRSGVNQTYIVFTERSRCNNRK